MIVRSLAPGLWTVHDIRPLREERRDVNLAELTKIVAHAAHTGEPMTFIDSQGVVHLADLRVTA